MSTEKSQDTVRRLLELDFSIAELSMLKDRGWEPARVLDAVHDLLDRDLTTEGYARQTFEEFWPELFTLEGPPVLFTPRAAAEFGEEETRFLWRPFLPIGDYTVLMAPGGAGKTFFLCAVAAAVSRGLALPGDVRPPEGPGTVLLISAEDRGELLKKRLRASGADLDRILLLDCTDSAGLNITDGWEQFAALVNAHRPRLLALDPWHGFLGADIDINRVNVVRPVFQRLANLAKDCACALLLISHVNKRAQGENINHAATGSADFINAARSALFLIGDPEDKDARIAVHTKSNYARIGRSPCFRITQEGGTVWDGFSDIDRDMLEAAARRRRSVGELLNAREEDERENQALLDALLDAANPFAVQRYSYTAFRAQYGETIFGTRQPKRALEAVADALYARGFALRAGVHVKEGGASVVGFTLAALETPGADAGGSRAAIQTA